MKINIHDEITTRHPDFAVSFFAVDAIPPYETDEARTAASAAIVRAVSTEHGDVDLSQSSAQTAYTAFYGAMGIKAKHVSTPPKQAQRVLRNMQYRSILPTIDRCMRIEYTTLVSFQVYDPNKFVDSHLLYRPAHEADTLVDLHGEVKKCLVGELVLADSGGPVHAVTTGNAASRSIDAASTRALVRVMKVPGFSQILFDRALAEVADAFIVQSVIHLTNRKPEGRVDW